MEKRDLMFARKLLLVIAFVFGLYAVLVFLRGIWLLELSYRYDLVSSEESVTLNLLGVEKLFESLAFGLGFVLFAYLGKAAGIEAGKASE